VPTTITIDPVTRIEGHLSVEVTVDLVAGVQQVVDAHCSGTLFRGFEIMMAGRDPRDAVPYAQRICGVCPVSHALAACETLEDAFGVAPSDNGRIIRNLVLGANFVQSHLLHFYHLSLVDFVDTAGLLDVPPWTPRWTAPDLLGGADAQTLVGHYVDAFEARRVAHQVGALFAGKLPCVASFVPGGCTERVTGERVAAFRGLLDGLRAFIDGTYLPDAQLLAARFPDWGALGAGSGDLLAFGVFDLDAGGSAQLLPGGRRVDGTYAQVDPARITEDLRFGWYQQGGSGAHPSQGVTAPDADAAEGYSWMKAPRYDGRPYELGPLARMALNGHHPGGPSVMDRIVARAEEAKLVADAMDGWLDELVPGAPTTAPYTLPDVAGGVGLTEAPRGALGHWMGVDGGAISRYQVITPTNWNASPRDDAALPGPIEDALVGTPVADVAAPVEVLRVVHSFDPCLACAVHVVRPGARDGVTVRTRVSPG